VKNVIIYIKVEEASYKTHDKIVNYLQAQIDNSLEFGWNPSDLIIITNFEFEYKNVKNIFPTNLCDYNIWANKFYISKELLEKYFKDDIWLHDYDVWQIDNFQFPKFNGMFAGCLYDDSHPNWNGGSFFFTKNSLPLLTYIQEYYELNRHIISKMDDGRGPKWFSDELVVSELRRIPEITNLFYTLSPQYNLGMTLFNTRYKCATKPIKMIHVKLFDNKEYSKFIENSKELNLIPIGLQKIIETYSKKISN